MSDTQNNICQIYFGTYTLGTQSQGIYHASFDLQNGKITSPELACKTLKPSFIAIHPDGQHLYAVSEGKPGKLSAFAIDPETYKLILINQTLSGGEGPCHVSVSNNGKTLLSANYVSGSLASIKINNDGSLGSTVSQIQHYGTGVNKERQEGPHVHSINLSPDNRFAYVADLGIDKIMIYKFDQESGALTDNQPAFFQAKPGAGPRHFTFHPNEKFAYLINELDNTILVLDFNAENGELREVQNISTLPESYQGDSKTAEIKVHPNGRFLYASNRGHDSIAIYAIKFNTGKLELIDFQTSNIKNPRHFNINASGKFCIVGNQDTDTILLFKINPKNGLLIPTNTAFSVGQPVCIKFLP